VDGYGKILNVTLGWIVTNVNEAGGAAPSEDLKLCCMKREKGKNWMVVEN
jgi:hypothetical protein